jgi:hypothetical protein
VFLWVQGNSIYMKVDHVTILTLSTRDVRECEAVGVRNYREVKLEIEECAVGCLAPIRPTANLLIWRGLVPKRTR